MAHYAELDENNIVKQVLYVDNQHILDENGNESEALGIAQCKEGLNNLNARLIRTSYSSSIRGRYASIGYSYDENLDLFLPPKPFDSWILNEETYEWEAPVAMPTNLEKGQYPSWNEESQSWEIKDLPPRQISIDEFRGNLTLTEKLLWDTPESGTIQQTASINTFKSEFPITIGSEETSQLVDLLVSSGVFTRERINELLDI
jgi:hypothetical protein